MIRADLHCHTRHSHDSFAPVRLVLEHAERAEITHLAITDHDQISGALRARDRSKRVQVIVGCEVSLERGAHLIGLFLERKVTSRTAVEAIDEIHGQGGFALVPHPFNPVSGLFKDGIDERALARVDAIEVCNGYEPAERNMTAAKLASDRQVPAVAGSDSHYIVDVGRACVEFPDAVGALDPERLRSALRRVYAPTRDLSALHASDAAFRAHTGKRARRLLPRQVRDAAKLANWLRFRRQIARQCPHPIRAEFRL